MPAREEIDLPIEEPVSYTHLAAVTLAQASTMDKEVKTKHCNKEAAKEVGALIAKRAKSKKITDVVFDRGGYIYHGVVKELADEMCIRDRSL